MTEFGLTEEQIELRKMARRFAAKEITPHVAEWDRDGHFPLELYPKAWEQGFVTCCLPEEQGGIGLGVLEQCLLMEEIAAADAGIAVSLAVSPLGMVPVQYAGSAAMKEKVLERFCSEPLWGALCVSEADAGSDVASLRTNAVREEGGYRLTGSKMFITNGTMADYYTVLAYTDRKAAHRGMSLFVVPRELEGVTPGKKEDKMGQRTSDTCEVSFQDVLLPEELLIGREGDGFKLIMKTFDKSRPVVGAIGVGLAQAALDHACTYAQERLQFGRPIARHQAIRFMLADAAIAIEGARQLVRQAARMTDAGVRSTAEAAMAKEMAARVAVDATRMAIQVFGGYGYSREYPVEKLYRDAKVLEIYEGTSEVQKMIVARSILG